MSPLSQFVLLTTLAASTVLAAPAPQQVFAPVYCKISYEVKEQHKKTDPAPQTGDYTVSGGSSLTAGSSFSVGTTVTVGADLGVTIKEVVSAGVSGSVATTETTGTSQGATVPCPQGPWKCALQIYPDILVVSGSKVPAKGSENYCKGNTGLGDYTVEVPQLGDNKAVQSRVEVCACRNYPGADDEGAPSLKCDECP